MLTEIEIEIVKTEVALVLETGSVRTAGSLDSSSMIIASAPPNKENAASMRFFQTHAVPFWSKRERAVHQGTFSVQNALRVIQNIHLLLVTETF